MQYSGIDLGPLFTQSFLQLFSPIWVSPLEVSVRADVFGLAAGCLLPLRTVPGIQPYPWRASQPLTWDAFLLRAGRRGVGLSSFVEICRFAGMVRLHWIVPAETR